MGFKHPLKSCTLSLRLDVYAGGKQFYRQLANFLRHTYLFNDKRYILLDVGIFLARLDLRYASQKRALLPVKAVDAF